MNLENTHKLMGFLYGGSNVVCVFCCFDPLPTNDTRVTSWTLHKPIGLYMGDLIVGIILQYMFSASYSCFLWLIND